MSETRGEIATAMARAKRRFPGYKLDACYPVCWPVYAVRLTLTVLAEHEISTAARYILRLAGLGPTPPTEFSRLLGLPEKFVAGAAAELLGGELVAQRPDLNLEITGKGRQVLAGGGRSWSPRREHMLVPFDPLARRVLDVDTNRLLYLDEVQKEGLFVLPAGSKPRLSEFHIEAIRHYARAEEGIRPDEITEVAEFHNRDARLRYRNDITVVGLVASGGGQPAFAAFRGREYLEEESVALQRLADSGVMVVPEEFREGSGEPWLLSSSVTSDEASLLSAIRDDYLSVNAAEQMIAETQDRQFETQDVRQRDQLTHSLTQLKAEKAELERQLAEKEQQLKERNDGDFRIIKTEEHRPLLLQAIDKAQFQLTLVSAWIGQRAFDAELRRKLVQAMERGVQVRIAWGQGTERGPEADRNLARGNYVLDELKRRTPVGMLDRLTVKRTEIHLKLIICDDQFCAWGSLNWLSYRGELDDGYRIECSSYSERPGEIAHWKAVADSLFS